MADAVIVDAVRTPLGKGKATGALAGRAPGRPAGAPAGRARRADRPRPRRCRRRDRRLRHPGRRAEPQHRPPRRARRRATPSGCPATTVDRQCGSSQQAIHFAAQGIHGRRLRRRGRRRRRVDEPGADGLLRAAAPTSAAPALRRALPRRPRLAGYRVRADRRPVGHRPRALDEFALRVAGARGTARDARLVRPRDRAAQGRRRPTARSSRWRATRASAPRRSRGSPALRPAFVDDVMASASRRSGGAPPPATRRRSPTARPPSCSRARERAAELGLRPRARIHALAVEGDDPL